VLEEHLADQLAAAAGAGLLEDRLEMVLDGVLRDLQRGGNLFVGETLDAQVGDLALALRQTVGERDQRRDLLAGAGWMITAVRPALAPDSWVP
jgi:hypothetical protein